MVPRPRCPSGRSAGVGGPGSASPRGPTEVPSESGVGVLRPPHRAPPPASSPSAAREEPGLRAAGARTPPPPAFVSAAPLRLPFLFPTRKAFIRIPGANQLPPAREPVPSAGRRPPARRPRSQSPRARGSESPRVAGRAAGLTHRKLLPSPGPGGAGRWAGVALGGRARAACGRPRAASGLAGGGRGAGVTTAARGSGRSRRGRAPGLAERGLRSRRAASCPPPSPRARVVTPSRLRVRAVRGRPGRGRRRRPPGTLGLWAVGDCPPESARSGSTLKVPGENPKLSREPGGGEWLRARDPAGHLAERASFLCLSPGRGHPGLGWAAASSAPSSPRNFFYSSQRAASTWGSEGPGSRRAA